MKRRFWWFRIGLPLLSLPLLLIGLERAGGKHIDTLLLDCVAFPAGLAVGALNLWVDLGNWSWKVALPIAVLVQWALIGYGLDRVIQDWPRLRDDPRRCPQCGYVRGLPAPRCPECGGAVTLLGPRDDDLGTPR